MAPFNSSPAGNAGHRNSGRSLTRVRNQAPSRHPSATNEDPAPSNTGRNSNPRAECNDQRHSSRRFTVLRFFLWRRNANEHHSPTTASGQSYAGMTEPPPLESDARLSRSPQQTSPNSDTETACQDLTRLLDLRTSLDIRASTHSSEDGDSSPDSDGDDAHSHDTEQISDVESDAEDGHNYMMLGAYNPARDQPVFFFCMYDTGAALSVLSYAKARLVAPDGIGDDVVHLRPRTLNILGGKVTVHGPIRVKFWLGEKGNRIQYEAPFYVLPRSYEEIGFDSLLNNKVVQRLGLVTIQRHRAAERKTRSAHRGGDRRATVAGSSSAD